MLKSLSRCCRQLESLCFLEPRKEIFLPEKDILPVLFGVTMEPSRTGSNDLFTKFAEERDFREKFEPQFPNLRKLDLDELYFEEEMLHTIYTLALLLQPKLVCFGKHTGLTRKLLLRYRRLWSIVQGSADNQVNLNLTSAKFVDSVHDTRGDAAAELAYLDDIVPMFKSLKSIELLKDYWKENDVVRFIKIFNSCVDTFSLNFIPVNNLTCLSNVTNVRATAERYSFENIHSILDNCPNLRTLSIHTALCQVLPPDQNSRRRDFGQVMEDEQRILENIMIGEIEALMPGMRALLEEVLEGNLGGYLDDDDDLGARANPPSPSQMRKTKYKVHQKLVTLRISSVFEASQEASEVSGCALSSNCSFFILQTSLILRSMFHL